MIKRDFSDYILDILNSIDEIKEFTTGINFEDFKKDKKTVNAVIRSLEVLGEAAKKIPDEIRKGYPQVPWLRMSGMRDKLIHQYFGVDLEIVWKVIKDELPPIKPFIKDLLEEMGKDS